MTVRCHFADVALTALLLGGCGPNMGIDPTGTLTVAIMGLPPGVSAAVTLSNALGYSRFITSSQIIVGLAPGAYTVAAGSVMGGDTAYAPSPSTQAMTVTGGTTAAATVAYAALSPGPPTVGALTIIVSGLPGSASGAVTVTGPAGFSQSIAGTQTFASISPGAYSIVATGATSGGTSYTPAPVTQTQTVVAGATVTATVMYAAGTTFGALTPGFQPRTMVVQGATYKYQIFIPQGYTPSQTWPVVLAVHGSDERGSDNNLQLTVGLARYVRAQAATFPAVVVFPQMPNPSPFLVTDSVIMASLDRTLAEVHADSARLYLTGLSLGAYRAWDLAYRFSTLFAALVPIAGDMCPACLDSRFTTYSQAYSAAAQQLRTLPVWEFVGGADSPQADRAISAAFALAGSAVFRYTEYPGLGHNVWDITYADPNLWSWLFAQHR